MDSPMVRIARHAARLRMARGSSGSGDYNSSSVAAAAAHYLDKRQSRVPVSGNGQQPTDTGSGSDTSQQTLTRETLTSETSTTPRQQLSTSTTPAQSPTTPTSQSTTVVQVTSTSTETSTPVVTTPTTTSTSSTIPVITTTVVTTSTSTPPATSTSTTSTTSSTETSSTTSSSTSRSLVTSFVTASLSTPSTTSSTTSSLSSDSSSSSSDGPSAGTVVGIVAGALVGVVVVSGIVGYFFRTKCKNDKDDVDDYGGENPFGNLDNAYGTVQSRSEMRRDSQLLGDGNDDDSIHQMSEFGHGYGNKEYGNAAPVLAAGAGGAAAAYGLARGNTTVSSSHSANNLPGLARSDTVNPRPPTMIQRHYAALNAAAAQQQQHPMPPVPNFQVGQIVNSGAYYPGNQMNQNGPYPSFPAPAAAAGAGAYGQQPQQNELMRGNSMSHNGAAQYSDPYGQQAQMEMPVRSGTPEYQNPQQYFHQASESFSSAVNSPFDSPDRSGMAAGTYGQAYGHNDGMHATQNYGQHPLREGAMPGSERAKRTLSVRNGGLNEYNDPKYNDPNAGEHVRDSIYGGM